MIKKVVNWVFGSFFRTMGRFFFFLFFGFLIAIIISKSNVNIKWTDLLGIETVKAVSYTTDVRAKSSSYFDINNASAFTCNSWDTCQIQIQPNSGTMQGYGIHINQNYDTRDKDFIEFSFMLSQPLYDAEYNTQGDIICTEWTQRGSTYICSDTYISTLGITTINQPSLTTFNFMPKVVYTNTNSAFCDIQGNKIICPTYHLQIQTLEINFIWAYNNQNTNATFLFSKVANNLYYNDASSAIENQTQQQAQEHNETMNFFNNENTTQAESSASNFFSNFTSQDNGGISSIITAPLSAISGLVNATCTQLTLPIPYLDNSELVLPCMSSIYTEHFGSFFTLYQTIIFGAVAYRMLISLFMMIQGFKNPDDDKIEVVDL